MRTHRHQVMVFIYFCLLAIVIASLSLFLYSIISLETRGWYLYTSIFFFMLLGYTWYIFILLFLADLRKTIYPRYDNEKIAVIVPCYNEKPELLKKALESVIDAEGNKQILIVDDGSKDEIRSEIKKVVSELQTKVGNIHIHHFEFNSGKRKALHYAVSNLVKDSQFIITIDSDTILDKNALIRIVEPLKIADIGGVSGDVRLLNENQNWLTKMIGTYYWIAMNIGKRSLSSRGMVACCSGCLAAYKSSIIKEVIDEFLEQEFLGEKCSHSEDRHLTNLVLERGFRVVYVPEAISYTETPATVSGFLKQQTRWQRGFVQESIYALTFAWRNNKMLFLQLLLWDLTAPFMTLGIQLAVITLIITNPTFFILYIFPNWIVLILLRNIFYVIHSRKGVRHLFTYAFFNAFVMYWMRIYALFTTKKKGWITR